MIQEEPAWTYQTDKGLNQWYGNVPNRLCPFADTDFAEKGIHS